MVWYDRVGGNIADWTVDHQSWWSPLSKDNAKLTNSCSAIRSLKFSPPGTNSMKPACNSSSTSWSTMSGWSCAPFHESLHWSNGSGLATVPVWVGQAGEGARVSLTPNGTPCTKSSKKWASESPRNDARRYHRCNLKGWPGGTANKWSPGGHPRSSIRSSMYGANSSWDRGGSLHPDKSAATIFRHCLVSLSRLNHRDRRLTKGSDVGRDICSAELGRPPPSSMRCWACGHRSLDGNIVRQLSNWRTVSPLDTNGAITLASALASSSGYSAVRRLKNVPSAIRTPVICRCTPKPCGQDLATVNISARFATNIHVLDQSLPNWQAEAWAAKGATVWIHWTMRGSSKVIDVAGFSKITSPPCWSTSDSNALERSWMAALSSTASCCCGELDGRPSMKSGVRTGAGPGDFNVALLCLLQYGAANAAPIKPDAAKSRTSSNVSSCKRSCPWIRSIGWTRSPKTLDKAVLTGMDAPEKISKKNFVGEATEKSAW